MQIFFNKQLIDWDTSENDLITKEWITTNLELHYATDLYLTNDTMVGKNKQWFDVFTPEHRFLGKIRFEQKKEENQNFIYITSSISQKEPYHISDLVNISNVSTYSDFYNDIGENGYFKKEEDYYWWKRIADDMSFLSILFFDIDKLQLSDPADYCMLADTIRDLLKKEGRTELIK